MAKHQPNYIRTYRKKLNLTQKELGRLIGCDSREAISRHEWHKQEPTLRTALAYEAIFGIPVSVLFRGLYVEVEHYTHVNAQQLVEEWLGDCEGPEENHRIRYFLDLLNSSHHVELHIHDSNTE